jgi:hypothetical protein
MKETIDSTTGSRKDRRNKLKYVVAQPFNSKNKLNEKLKEEFDF